MTTASESHVHCNSEELAARAATYLELASQVYGSHNVEHYNVRMLKKISFLCHLTKIENQLEDNADDGFINKQHRSANAASDNMM